MSRDSPRHVDELLRNAFKVTYQRSNLQRLRYTVRNFATPSFLVVVFVFSHLQVQNKRIVGFNELAAVIVFVCNDLSLTTSESKLDPVCGDVCSCENRDPVQISHDRSMMEIQ
ncbi:unnamed protein product [Pseudo-nitzschia multistriata]|uniref:Uncharacterized protein n=1 Tax=Pseudo-nitzschia multistriata TaxID=183589 RepID=A0A448ZLK5_9STRA|nr:unnamed protein product [Pseudo-nitzschia multistriata]